MKELYIILHVFGVIVGMGGAFASDAMFLHSIRDKSFSKTELTFLKIGSTLVWTGLAIIILTGIMIFLSDPEKYMASSKFQVKMAIVAIITINGVIFHGSHIPRMKRHTDHHLPSSDEFVRSRSFLLASGAVSGVSWTCAFLLGMLRSIPVSFGYGMLVYLAIVSTAVLGVLALRNVIIPHHRA